MKKLVLAGAVLAACLTTTSANAFNNGSFTVGAVGGFTKSSGDLSNLNSDSNIGGSRFSKRYEDDDLKGLGIKAFGEYNFNDNFALGTAYDFLYLGSVKGYSSFSSGGVTVYKKTDYSLGAHVFEFYGKGQIQLSDNFTVFAKAGPTLSFIGLSDDDDDDKVDTSSCVGFVAGVGAEYKFNNGVAIRAGYDYFNRVGKVTTDYTSKEEKINSHLLYAGASYTF